MPPRHHHCGCPNHQRGRPCPYCDDLSYWPGAIEDWETPRQSDAERISRQLQSLHEAIGRLNARIEALEADRERPRR